MTQTESLYGTTGNITTIQLGTDNTGAALSAYGTADTVTFASTSSLTNVNVAEASSLAAALAIADIVAEGTATAGTSITSGNLAWFNYACDTYILQNGNSTSTSGVDATDTVVKIVGIHGLSNSSGVVTISG